MENIRKKQFDWLRNYDLYARIDGSTARELIRKHFHITLLDEDLSDFQPLLFYVYRWRSRDPRLMKFLLFELKLNPNKEIFACICMMNTETGNAENDCLLIDAGGTDHGLFTVRGKRFYQRRPLARFGAIAILYVMRARRGAYVNLAPLFGRCVWESRAFY